MPPRTSLNAKNLEALGAPRLAALLIEISTGSAAAQRRLRLELAGTGGTEPVAREIRKRLASLARSRGVVDWSRRTALVKDLEVQRRAIVEAVATSDPAEGLGLMWQFLALAAPTLERCDDGSGAVTGVFAAALADLGAIAAAARPDPARLADAAFEALSENGHGQYDDLVATLAPTLGPAGLDHLRERLAALAEPAGPRSSGAGRRLAWVRGALMDVADARGDVDGFVAQHDEPARRQPGIAAGIARRLLAAGRTGEAWQAIEAAGAASRVRGAPDLDWEDARIAVLEALGRAGEAQAARWSWFERSLAADPLRAYLRRLPDFEDLEAEERALAHAQAVRDPLQALAFLVAWPALDRAAALVIGRARDLDGDRYEVLGPAADALAGRYPLAATLALRAMIDDTLAHNRSSRYRHAARHLLECESLASAVADWRTVEPHGAYAARLKAKHGRKSGFWSVVS